MINMANKIDHIIPFSSIRRVKNLVFEKSVSLAKAREAAPDADIIINTALFDMSNGGIISRVVADGKQYGSEASWASTWGIGFKENKTPVLTWNNGVKAPEFVGPYSSAVYEGKIGDGLNDKSKRGRTALGLAGENLVVVCVPDNGPYKMTTAALCQYMKDKGCTFAINLDGGGSSQFVAPDGTSYSSGRKCPAWLAIWLEHDNDTAPTPEVKCVCKKRIYTRDSNGKLEGFRYIAVGDNCVLKGVTENCLIEVVYPTSQGMRTAYINNLEGFEKA